MDGRPPGRGSPTWERREGMPVHRHLHDKQGSVYAFCSELDAWSEGRRTAAAQNEESPSEPAAPTVTAPKLPVSTWRSPAGWRWWLPIGFCGALLAAALVAYWLAVGRDLFWRDPLADAKVTQLTDLSGTAQAAALCITRLRRVIRCS